MYCCAAILLRHYSNKWFQEYLFQIKGFARNPRYICANSLVKQSNGEHHNCRASWYFADNAQYSPFTLAFNTRKCTHTHSYYEVWVFNNCILLYIVRHSVMYFNVFFFKCNISKEALHWTIGIIPGHLAWFWNRSRWLLLSGQNNKEAPTAWLRSHSKKTCWDLGVRMNSHCHR